MTMEKKKLTFTQFMAHVAVVLEKENHAPAAHVHRSALRSFKAFLNGQRTLFTDITPTLLKRYETWLSRQGKSRNTISTYLRALRSTYNRAVERGLARFVPRLFHQVYTGICAPTKRALTRDEVKHIIEAEVPAELKQAQEWFSLMFYLRGMPFIDLAHLRPCDYDGCTLTYSRHKTLQMLQLEVPVEARSLIHPYTDSNDSPYLFPILQKEGENYASALRTLNKQLDRLARHVLPYRHITSYTARHSWATIAYHLGISVGVVSCGLGHTSIRTTESYLAPLAYKKIDEAHRMVLDAVFGGKRKKVSA